MNHIAVQIGEAIVATAVMIGQLGVVDSKLVQDGGVNVVNMHRVLDGFPAKVIRLAIAEPTLEASPPQATW